ncbi:signal peptidase II [Rhodobium gokarnense]|uniref:Lipoprotein signal peptidase n=1 Tax=Rhodobium gokarnense TaxID=364296 RepID=A0ABT3HCP0_9HYPH|nr:signal peptidase II [Rhodobium gokarnense]MCW2308166.1 signal peptidase II [Rhodobium gokarnense]
MTEPRDTDRARRARSLGLAVLVFGLLVDQIHKYWMLHVVDIAEKSPIAVTSWFNLVLTWNRGVSYGLFQQDSHFGRWVLIAVTAVAGVVFLLWLLRATRFLPAISLGLVLGGALGNGIDRVFRGAVADFFHFHIGQFSWYVFNFADIWIVAGVVGLLYDSLVGRPKDAAKDGQEPTG